MGQWRQTLSIAAVAALFACSGRGTHDDSSATGESGGPPCTDCTPIGAMTYALPSPAGATVWTTTTMDKVVREAAPPTEVGDAIEVYAARNEFEPFQVVVRPDAGAQVQVALSPLTGPGTIDAGVVHRVDYVQIAAPSDPGAIPSPAIPDPLAPIAYGDPVTVAAAENQPFWITLRIPTDAAPGDYTGELTITVDDASEVVPIRLHVFDFALPAEIGFDGNWNTSFEALGGGASLDRVEVLKDWFYDHRLVPSSVAWPAGLNYDGGITYDCDAGAFLAEDNVYDFSQLGPKYIDGQGWNGVGFPSFQIMDFVNESSFA